MEELRSRIDDQISTYLPDFLATEINIVINSDRTCNVEITIDDTIYTYDSKNAPVPITLTDMIEGAEI